MKRLLLLLFTITCYAQEFNKVTILPDQTHTTPGKLVFQDNSGNEMGFQAPTSLTAVTWTLPSADSAGCFNSDGAGTLTIVSCSGGGLPTSDSTNIVKDDADATKLMRFEIGGFTTGTTRVLTPQDANTTIAGVNLNNNFTVDQLPDTDNTRALGSTSKAWSIGYTHAWRVEELDIAATGTSFGSFWKVQALPGGHTFDVSHGLAEPLQAHDDGNSGINVSGDIALFSVVGIAGNTCNISVTSGPTIDCSNMASAAPFQIHGETTTDGRIVLTPGAVNTAIDSRNASVYTQAQVAREPAVVIQNYTTGSTNSLFQILDHLGNIKFAINGESASAGPGANGLSINGHTDPGVSITYDLGASSARWRKLWVQDIDCSGSCGSSSGTVTSIATTLPITGGTITTTGTIACPTCVTTDTNQTITAIKTFSSTGSITFNASSLGVTFAADNNVNIGSNNFQAKIVFAHQLTVGNTSAGSVLFNGPSGSFAAFAGPTSSGPAWILNLPITNPTAGQCLGVSSFGGLFATGAWQSCGNISSINGTAPIVVSPTTGAVGITCPNCVDTTSTQTITGSKTFNAQINASGGLISDTQGVRAINYAVTGGFFGQNATLHVSGTCTINVQGGIIFGHTGC